MVPARSVGENRSVTRITDRLQPRDLSQRFTTKVENSSQRPKVANQAVGAEPNGSDANEQFRDLAHSRVPARRLLGYSPGRCLSPPLRPWAAPAAATPPNSPPRETPPPERPTIRPRQWKRAAHQRARARQRLPAGNPQRSTAPPDSAPVCALRATGGGSHAPTWRVRRESPFARWHLSKTVNSTRCRPRCSRAGFCAPTRRPWAWTRRPP